MFNKIQETIESKKFKKYWKQYYWFIILFLLTILVIIRSLYIFNSNKTFNFRTYYDEKNIPKIQIIKDVGILSNIYNISKIDYALFSIWFIFLIYPLISEVSAFGISIKKEFGKFKEEIRSIVTNIRINNNFDFSSLQRFADKDNKNEKFTKKIELYSDKKNIEFWDDNGVEIIATIKDENGNTVNDFNDNIEFSIISGSGTLSDISKITENGKASVFLIPSNIPGSIVISASSINAKNSNIVINIINKQSPQIVNIHNNGCRLINIVFDKALNKETAETVTNYIIKNSLSEVISVYNAKLLYDEKTVQLFLGAGIKDNEEISVSIKNIYDISHKHKIENYEQKLSIKTNKSVLVSAVEGLGSMAIRITFSEPVQGASTIDNNSNYLAFKLDDKILSTLNSGNENNVIYGVSITYPDSNDYTKALITFYNKISTGAHVLTISYNGSIMNYDVDKNGLSNSSILQPAGYVAIISDDINKDNLFLSLVNKISNTKFRYIFSKPIMWPSVNSFFWSSLMNQTSGTFASSVTKINDTTYDVTWSTEIPEGTIYFYAGTKNNNIKDYSGNEIPRMSFYGIDTNIKKIDIDSNSFIVMNNELSNIKKELDFEKIFNYIFYSQISLLRYLKDAKNNGIDSLVIKNNYFSSLKEAFKEVFKNTEYDQYLFLLKLSDLIIEENNNIYITAKGIEFLEYIDKMNYQKEYKY